MCRIDEENPPIRNCALVDRLANNSEKRRKALLKNGRIITSSVKSNDAYLKTIFLIKERASRHVLVPMSIVMLNAIIWTILIKVPFKNRFVIRSDPWGSITDLVFSTTLSFILVFRLNRVAIRWWDTRGMWGLIVAHSRMLTDAIMTHTNHAPRNRDRAISWLGGFLIAVKQHMRKEKNFDYDELAGFLDKNEVNRLASSSHPCLHATSEIRYELSQAFKITNDTPSGLGIAYSSVLRMMEKSIHVLIDKMGGLERVSSTPLPIVYVTHLRTFLLTYLLTLPWVHGHQWGWATIPIVALTAYALLGVDAAATECEAPFKKRSNHLAMESFCLTGFNDIEALVKHHVAMQSEKSRLD